MGKDKRSGGQKRKWRKERDYDDEQWLEEEGEDEDEEETSEDEEEESSSTSSPTPLFTKGNHRGDNPSDFRRRMRREMDAFAKKMRHQQKKAEKAAAKTKKKREERQAACEASNQKSVSQMDLDIQGR